MFGFVLAAIVAVILYALTAFYPPVSEDWIHLEALAQCRSVFDAIDLRLSHSKPLEFLSLWLMVPTGLDHPYLIRIPQYAMHALIGGMVGLLARSLGLSPRRAQLAVVLFLCFPAVKGLSWIVAISTPEHVLMMLIALVAAVEHTKRPRAATGILLLLAQMVAIGTHSASSLLPGCVAALAVAVSPRRWRVLLDPWLLAHIVLGVALVVVLASLSTAERHHSVRGFEAIAANGFRALMSLVPEVVRGPAIEGMRGAYGQVGKVLGLCTCLVMAVVVAKLFLRASLLVRALLFAAAIDLVPPVLTAGFVVRYAYFPAALVAVALLLSAKPTRRWVVGLSLLGLAWCYDSGVDVVEVRRGGDLAIAVVEAARVARTAAGPGVQVALVDPPGEVGAERDVPVFNWGLSIALRRNGVEGPWQLLRTRDYVTSSDVERVDEEKLAQLARDGVQVWRFDGLTARFVRRQSR